MVVAAAADVVVDVVVYVVLLTTDCFEVELDVALGVVVDFEGLSGVELEDEVDVVVDFGPGCCADSTAKGVSRCVSRNDWAEILPTDPSDAGLHPCGVDPPLTATSELSDAVQNE